MEYKTRIVFVKKKSTNRSLDLIKFSIIITILCPLDLCCALRWVTWHLKKGASATADLNFNLILFFSVLLRIKPRALNMRP
jgi:hypothetical protein